MMFLFLIGLLIPAIAYTEETTASIPQLSSEQIAHIEQLMDSYPVEDLLDTKIVFQPLPFEKGPDGWTITKILSEEELLEKLVFLSCDNKKERILALHVPTLLKELTLHEKFLMTTQSIESASEQEKKRISEVQDRIMRINYAASLEYKSSYLQGLKLSKDELEIMDYYHNIRFSMEATRLLHTMLEKDLAEQGNALQKSIFENIARVTNETAINPFKTHLVEVLKKNQKA
jgi:hypothetical protein